MASSFQQILLTTYVSFHMMACSDLNHRITHKNNLISNPKIQNKGHYSLNSSLPVYYVQTKKIENSIKATIYIEGDGFAYVSRSKPSDNPTPKTPVGLQLALQDTGNHSIYYIARPCQYIDDEIFSKRCTKKYWTTHRYAPEIIDSLNHTINHIKSNTDITSFNLVGFSGGGNIAGLLAMQRDDIESIRSVAGNLDNDFFTKYHKVSDMPYSLNMADYADKLSSTPQIHYISENDAFVPSEITKSYLNKLPHKNCTKVINVKNTTHLEGWDKRWPDLLQNIPQCK